MFLQHWRAHWGLDSDPFSCEDADKDHLLDVVDPSAVHSSFDRVFGNPGSATPAVVFGEKGSGKSALRRIIQRRLAAHAEAGGERVFAVEYVDFDPFLETFRRATRASDDAEKFAKTVTNEWTLADHVDALLSLGVRRLVDELLEGDARGLRDALPEKPRHDALLLAALYYDSPERTRPEAIDGLRKKLGVRRTAVAARRALLALGVAASVAIAAVPWIPALEASDKRFWFLAGGAALAASLLAYFLPALARSNRARLSVAGLRSVPRDPAALARVMGWFRTTAGEHVFPASSEPGTRYGLLERFQKLLAARGYASLMVLVDRIDEPSALSTKSGATRHFVETLLDIKLLQLPGVAFKLFLPIELETIYRNTSPQDLERMRLDKSNLVPELRWTGEELYEIASQRLAICRSEGREPLELDALLADDLDPSWVRSTLAQLGTPRHAFGFLSSLVTEYVRDLPIDVEPDDPRWRIPRAHFDVVRATWIDRAGILRRTLN